MAETHLVIGKITGVFGVNGWVKVFSDTSPRENIVNYSPWLLEKGREQRLLKVIDGRIQGKGVVARLETIERCEQAEPLSGWTISIARSQLPDPEEGEYYWSDLIGLAVVTTTGVSLGVVDHLLETGANDVLVVKGDSERLIPFIQGSVLKKIDLVAGLIEVDWDPDF
ncbi:MAG: ribosome maturation factor RimM [Methylococcales bacterium]|nr:ribosome maturation factor RimM [Methylococcales bacterium]